MASGEVVKCKTLHPSTQMHIRLRWQYTFFIRFAHIVPHMEEFEFLRCVFANVRVFFLMLLLLQNKYHSNSWIPSKCQKVIFASKLYAFLFTNVHMCIDWLQSAHIVSTNEFYIASVYYKRSIASFMYIHCSMWIWKYLVMININTNERRCDAATLAEKEKCAAKLHS